MTNSPRNPQNLKPCAKFYHERLEFETVSKITYRMVYIAEFYFFLFVYLSFLSFFFSFLKTFRFVKLKTVSSLTNQINLSSYTTTINNTTIENFAYEKPVGYPTTQKVPPFIDESRNIFFPYYEHARVLSKSELRNSGHFITTR